MGDADKKLKQNFLVPLPGVNTTQSSNERLSRSRSFEGIVWWIQRAAVNGNRTFFLGVILGIQGFDLDSWK
jgi:hypothetical protein